MFGPPGHAYVYLVYGMYHCLNVVTQPRGFPAALLVRSVDPVDGADLMRRARQEWIVARAARHDDGLAGAARAAAARQRVAALPIERLASGPGLVCAAFSIGRDEDGADLCDPAASLRLEPARPDDPALEPTFGPRVGLGATPEPWLSKPWRVWAAGNPAVSGSRATR